MDKTKDIENRIREQANRAYNEGRYVFTDFMGIAELAVYYRIKNELSFVDSKVFGGTETSERGIIRFGSEELCGYDEEFPIVLLSIEPVQKKFADRLTHRDFLGSVIGLGLERDKLGDIFIQESTGYIFVMDSIAEYIENTLTYVKHTKIRVKRCESLPENVGPKLAEKNILVSSNRIDAIVSKVYGLSREESLTLFRDGNIYLNGVEMTSNAKSLSPDDIVSVRGYGRFIFKELSGLTRKNKQNIIVEVYI